MSAKKGTYKVEVNSQRKREIPNAEGTNNIDIMSEISNKKKNLIRDFASKCLVKNILQVLSQPYIAIFSFSEDILRCCDIKKKYLFIYIIILSQYFQ